MKPKKKSIDKIPASIKHLTKKNKFGNSKVGVPDESILAAADKELFELFDKAFAGDIMWRNKLKETYSDKSVYTKGEIKTDNPVSGIIPAGGGFREGIAFDKEALGDINSIGQHELNKAIVHELKNPQYIGGIYPIPVGGKVDEVVSSAHEGEDSETPKMPDRKVDKSYINKVRDIRPVYGGPFADEASDLEKADHSTVGLKFDSNPKDEVIFPKIKKNFPKIEGKIPGGNYFPNDDFKPKVEKVSPYVEAKEEHIGPPKEYVETTDEKVVKHPDGYFFVAVKKPFDHVSVDVDVAEDNFSAIPRPRRKREIRGYGGHYDLEYGSVQRKPLDLNECRLHPNPIRRYYGYKDHKVNYDKVRYEIANRVILHSRFNLEFFDDIHGCSSGSLPDLVSEFNCEFNSRFVSGGCALNLGIGTYGSHFVPLVDLFKLGLFSFDFEKNKILYDYHRYSCCVRLDTTLFDDKVHLFVTYSAVADGGNVSKRSCFIFRFDLTESYLTGVHFYGKSVDDNITYPLNGSSFLKSFKNVQRFNIPKRGGVR